MSYRIFIFSRFLFKLCEAVWNRPVWRTIHENDAFFSKLFNLLLAGCQRHVWLTLCRRLKIGHYILLLSVEKWNFLCLGIIRCLFTRLSIVNIQFLVIFNNEQEKFTYLIESKSITSIVFYRDFFRCWKKGSNFGWLTRHCFERITKIMYLVKWTS